MAANVNEIEEIETDKVPASMGCVPELHLGALLKSLKFRYFRF